MKIGLSVVKFSSIAAVSSAVASISWTALALLLRDLAALELAGDLRRPRVVDAKISADARGLDVGDRR